MKAYLVFNLPEDLTEYKMANRASDMHSVLWDHDQWLRSKIKYEELDDAQHEAYKKCRENLRELLIENNIELL
jgi:hypothetical protein